MLYSISRTFPEMFAEFDQPDDACAYLAACVEPSISPEYTVALVRSFQNHVDLFKSNETQILTVIEQLTSLNEIKQVERFVDGVLVKHFDAVSDMERCIRMTIRLCSSVSKESVEALTAQVLSRIVRALGERKYNKKLAPIFFELILAILDLTVPDAPSLSHQLLSRNEFYPWKELSARFTHLVKSCAAYDTIGHEPSKLDQFDERLLTLVHDRAKINPTILQATHQPALEAVLKWTTLINKETGQLFAKHVFRMGQPMTDLIDERQITGEACGQLLATMQERLADDLEEFTVSDQVFLSVSESM